MERNDALMSLGEVEPALALGSLEKDFTRLVQIFDGELSLQSDVRAGVILHLTEAKDAAQRGLILVRQMAKMLSGRPGIV